MPCAARLLSLTAVAPMSELIVRCSSIGKLMAKPDNEDLDPSLMAPEVRAIIAKTRRTDEEKSVLDDVRRKSLSAGGKSHVRELLRESIYGYEPAELGTYPIRKGREVEAACIDLLARLTGRPLTKNTERRSNGLISGECDVWDAPLRTGRDIKAPYSMASMPMVLADCYESVYEWQMHGYNELWDARAWSVDYVLVNTPEELIGYEPTALHVVDHIPEHLRWTTWEVKRDRALNDLIVGKVLAARRYYRWALNEFDRTHRIPGGDAGAALLPKQTQDDPAPWLEVAPATQTKATAPDALPAELF